MSTVIIRFPTATLPQRRAPVFNATTLRTYSEYLAARNGIDHYQFTTLENLPDEIAARSFSEEMRRQLGHFLTEIISVEQKRHRVMIVLRDGFTAET